jgi:hypothetical protein
MLAVWIFVIAGTVYCFHKLLSSDQRLDTEEEEA